jgi:hypothetical protein
MNETDTVMDLNWTISNRRSTEVKEKEKLNHFKHKLSNRKSTYSQTTCLAAMGFGQQLRPSWLRQ